jgi:type VI protein secretion system component Hcp
MPKPRPLTYANVVSTGCLFLVLGGSAYAAVSITGKDVRNGSLTGADIRDHSLHARDFKRGDLPRGPRGPAGPAGPAGTVPAVAHVPVGRLSLPGITFSVRRVAWANTLDGNPWALGGGAAPKPVWGSLVVTKAPDKSSPALWDLTATGKHVASAALELLAPGASAPYARYALQDVSVTRFSTRAAGGEREDEVALGYATATPTFNIAAPLPATGASEVGALTVDGIAGSSPVVLDAWQLGKAQPGAFEIGKPVDRSSPALFARFAAGQHIKRVTISRYLPGTRTAYATYVLSDAVISSYSVSGEGRPVERIGFAARRIETTTPARACFDRATNASC